MGGGGGGGGGGGLLLFLFITGSIRSRWAVQRPLKTRTESLRMLTGGCCRCGGPAWRAVSDVVFFSGGSRFT